MPKGEPTRTVRLPCWLLDDLEKRAARVNLGLPAYLTKQLAPRPSSPLQTGAAAERCTCAKPTLSRYATTICTTCGRIRG